MKKYLALTIGPVFNTIKQARKTRELWATSFMFSRLMEIIVGHLKSRATIYLPVPIEDNTENRFGAGLYNDRLFADVHDLSKEDILGIINIAVEEIALELTVEGHQVQYRFWADFFRIEWVIKALGNVENGKLIEVLTPYLDSLELAMPYEKDEMRPTDNPFILFLNDVYRTPLNKHLHGAKGHYKGFIDGFFPSTFDIATLELFAGDDGGSAYDKLRKSAESLLKEKQSKSKKVKQDDDQSDKLIECFYELLYSESKENPLKEKAKDCHKYFCIVYADADNIGGTIETLGETGETYQAFSKKLSDYAHGAAKLIDAFGGKPVYIGGDDLLFFAPVRNYDGKSIFNLIQQLDVEFKALSLAGSPTLSFGLTMTYYKYPLFEANQQCYDQLRNKAKEVKWGNGKTKNAVAFKLIKHSGAFFEGILNKELLNKFVEVEDDISKAPGDLISSVAYKLETMKPLLDELGDNLGERLPHLFANFFNEGIHKRHSNQLNMIQEVLKLTYESNFTLADLKDLDRNHNLYSILRILKFITDRPTLKTDKTSTQQTHAEVI